MSLPATQKYYWIALTSAKSNLAYLGEVGSRVVFLGVILYIFLRLWQVTYSETHSTSLGGLTLPQMLWYLALTESIILSGPRSGRLLSMLMFALAPLPFTSFALSRILSIVCLIH